MQNDRASITALVTAFIRAYHATHDPDPIFDDRLATQLFTEEEFAAFSMHLASTVARFDPDTAASEPDEATALAAVVRAQSIPLCRGRYAEDCLRRQFEAGVRQYVILGAGLDTFALRWHALAEELRVFEVDHPATQADKRMRLARLGGEIPRQLYFLPVDFAQESLAAAMRSSPYDPQSKSFFSWLGVSYYLPRGAVLATLQTVASIAAEGSMVVFDYMVPDSCLSQQGAQNAEHLRQVTQHAGEPLITTFTPSQLASELEAIGLRIEEDLGASEIQSRYLSGRGVGGFEHLRFARVVVAEKSPATR